MNIILIGAQGSGKGTQARMLKQHGFTHLCSGDIMREEAERKTELGIQAKSYWDKGSLAPDEVTIKMLGQHIKGENVVFDGFPRTVAQAKALDDTCRIDGVIVLELSEKDAVARLSQRMQCKCGMIYGMAQMPKKQGTCDRCGQKLYQREDDTPDKIRQRLKEYTEKTRPVIDYYEKKGAVHSVDASKQPEEVYAQIKNALKL